MLNYTQGEWKINLGSDLIEHEIYTDKWIIAKVRSPIISDAEIREVEANAHLIASAPLGYELAEFVSRISATWIDEGLLEMGEGDYLRMKQLALALKSKAEDKAPH